MEKIANEVNDKKLCNTGCVKGFMGKHTLSTRMDSATTLQSRTTPLDE
jgi:hypothetical protein